MVLINGVKYSCDACIKSHKASQCDHADRPLKLLKPRGRPATTCDHCKDMRKTKNVNPSGSCHCSKLEKIRKEKGITIEEDMLMTGNFDMCLCIRGEPCKCHSRRKKAQKRDKKELLSPEGSESLYASPGVPVSVVPTMTIDNSDILTTLGPVEQQPEVNNNYPISNNNNDMMADFLHGEDVKIGEQDPFYSNLQTDNNLNTTSIENFGQLDRFTNNDTPLPEDILQQGNIGNTNNDSMEDSQTQGLTLNDLDELLAKGIELSNAV